MKGNLKWEKRFSLKTLPYILSYNQSDCLLFFPGMKNNVFEENRIGDGTLKFPVWPRKIIKH